jgi:hypothetical protein
MAAAVFLVWLAVAGVGWMVGKTKGRGLLGFVLGALLGLIGIIIVAVMKPARPSARQVTASYRAMPVEEHSFDLTCPDCQTPARVDALACWKCGRNFVTAGYKRPAVS